ncbi:MAG: IS4 family transposase [Nostoc sp. DedQUE08]|uniref:IS4 family transposase n=1 Tax=Nostoc sp. DedQUE08 TaxID=3075393 RepID=UPI002AD2B17D|nr:IS4 family transposase [Nostoc sp. DedQUE08]MDZ8071170.1 IS4 family transposase [Nostoc sp. DedQUE08]
MARIGSVVDLEATARQYGALRRARKLRSAEELLRLALLHGPGGLSLRSTALAACEAGLADQLSDKAVQGRLQRMGEWLEHILERLLAGLTPAAAGGLSLVDGTLVTAAGAKGAPWRVHARYDPALGRFTDLRLTPACTAEAVAQTRLEPGRIMVFDRGYGRVRNVAEVLAAGSEVVTRIGWRAIALYDASGDRIDLLSLLPVGQEACEHEVHLAGIARPMRLVLQRLPPAQAATQRKRTTRRAGKRCQALDPRTLAAAEHLILLTSLPHADATPDRVIALYRGRWQVELGFKRLKSLGGLDRLAASDPRSARTWLLAHLIAAVLTEDLASRIAGFSPSKTPATAAA